MFDVTRGRFKNLRGWVLMRRSELTGNPDDIASAVQILREAIAGLPVGHVERAAYRSNLGIMLTMLSRSVGGPDVLREAVQLCRDAVDQTPTHSPMHPKMLVNLGTALLRLYSRTDESDVLREAVRVFSTAAEEAVDESSVRVGVLTSLGSALVAEAVRFDRTDLLQDGVDALLEADRLRPDRARVLSNLALFQGMLYGRTGDVDTGWAAVRTGRRVLAMTPARHSARAGRLTMQMNRLVGLSERTGDETLLWEAVGLGRDAAGLIASERTSAAAYLVSVGVAFADLAGRTGDRQLAAEARRHLATAFRAPRSPLLHRLHAGEYLFRAEMTGGDPEAALAVVEALVELMPRVSPRVLARADRENLLGRLSGLAGNAAAVAVEAGQPGRAVELLEQSRGILISRTIDDRSELADLDRVAPELASLLADLRERTAALEEPGLPGESRVSDHQSLLAMSARREELDAEWDVVLARIRAVPGFGAFLRSPGIHQLCRQAAYGPIVMVYAGEHGSGALVVATRGIRAVSLPRLDQVGAVGQAGRLVTLLEEARSDSFEGRSRAENELHAIVEWLWDAIAEPVLADLSDAGELTEDNRIWWCPVGALAYLPVHAAGYHREDGTRTLFGRVASSYVTTIRVLEHIRAGRVRDIAPSALVVAMPTTPGASSLPGVEAEVAALTALLPDPLVLSGQNATAGAVIEALPQRTMAHFACHGRTNDADPGASMLLLHDYPTTPLTVAELSRLDLSGVELAYLSACSSARTGPSLVDENVHIAAAVHIAGYRHVVGTLWEINDRAATEIARGFYMRILERGPHTPDGAAVARAVGEAVGQIPGYPTRVSHWAAHMHYGI